ncbi:hypothetical protein CY34DRAFT_808419 [Suillus luteus UH-Slu-Lm8-n1]|uniref:Unplaced genomic scaffold CY34scaffold_217, whole genome shotgun sequence n=1 Tax=Suillus luteus UH-Slu-Lm8-n1 TaxID=930992 RepID=A0A0D0AY71_9AGAM|nr:hypothetical protein CY34DRAFT_808419 [Suillus luteus UH-Slu-Lm8-n1]
MQAIQTQQHSILTAVLPLLPLVQAFPLHADQAKTFITDNVLSSISSLNRDIDSMKSSLSDLSPPSNSIQSVSKSTAAVPPFLTENHPTRKRTNSWLNQEDAHSGRSQSGRPHSVAPMMGSPRMDHHKKPRLDSVLRAASPQLVRPHTANSPAKHALDLRGLTSPAHGSDTNSGYAVAPRPEYTTRMPLTDIMPPLVNHGTMQFQKPVAESSSSGPRANFPTNIRRMHASSQSGRHSLLSVRAHEAIPPASTAAQISLDISTTAAKPANFVPPTTNQDRMKTPESVPPISKAIKLEEVLRSPLRCYISIPPSPLSSLSPSPIPTPARSVLKSHVQHAADGVARRQVTFATSNQAFTSSARPNPSVSSLLALDSMSASMSLRDRRAQMSMLGRTASSAKRFIPLGSSSDEEG